MATGPTQPPAPDPLFLDLTLNREVIVGRVDRNVTQEFIIITADKARLILHDAADCMERRDSWQTPAGILVTILVIFPTTAFQNFLGITKEVWNAFFIMAAILSAVWCIRALLRRRKAFTIEEIVNLLRTAQASNPKS